MAAAVYSIHTNGKERSIYPSLSVIHTYTSRERKSEREREKNVFPVSSKKYKRVFFLMKKEEKQKKNETKQKTTKPLTIRKKNTRLKR